MLNKFDVPWLLDSRITLTYALFIYFMYPYYKPNYYSIQSMLIFFVTLVFCISFHCFVHIIDFILSDSPFFNLEYFFLYSFRPFWAHCLFFLLNFFAVEYMYHIFIHFTVLIFICFTGKVGLNGNFQSMK